MLTASISPPPGLNASHCEPLRRNVAVLKPRSRRSRLGIKQKIKIPTGNTFGIEDFPGFSPATWLRLKRMSFTPSQEYKDSHEKVTFSVSRFWKLFIYFSEFEASHHIEGASYTLKKKKKKSLCTAGNRWRNNWHEHSFFLPYNKLWLCHRQKGSKRASKQS